MKAHSVPRAQNSETVAETMIEGPEWRWVLIASGLLVLLVALPYIVAYGAATPGGQFFTGVLVNPIDGASYQAKMFQGLSGSWHFTLPYTPEPHRGVVLFTFYLGLGHIARVLGLPMILVFHAARLAGSLLMFVMLYLFIVDWMNDPAQRRLTWALAALSGGFGWLALVLGRTTPTPDLLILPEAFPLQAAYSNPHFPLSIAAALWLAHSLYTMALIKTERWPVLDWRTIGMAVATVALVSMSPFILLPIGVGYGALLAVLWRERRAFPRREFAWGTIVLIFGVPLATYNLWAISDRNPVFQAWMAQNLTPSPPVWDYLIAFGPLLILAGVGLWGARRHLRAGDALLIGWLVGGALMLYAPLGLQRRFSMGLIVPLSVYASIGLWRVIAPALPERWRLLPMVGVFSLILPTTALALVIPLEGTRIPSESHHYYLSAAEQEVLEWLAEKTGNDALVLASPEFSLFLPTRGVRVVYGHPFETLDAERRQLEVLGFYAGEDCSVVQNEGVDYIVVGPRERLLMVGGQMCPVDSYKEVLRSSDGEVIVYAVTDSP